MGNSGNKNIKDTQTVLNQLFVTFNQILLNKILDELNLENTEELYSLYLSQDQDLHVLAKSLGISRENIKSIIAFVINFLGQDIVDKINEDYKTLKEQDTLFGAFNPEDKRL